MSESIPMRFPKVKSPFKREETEHGYSVYDEVNEGFDWVFNDDDVVAVEKLDGTNCAVQIEETETGLDLDGYTRHGYEPMQYADPYGSREHQYVVRAIQNSFQRGYLDDLDEGVHYGEVVGPDFHGNRHELSENLFIPFEWLRDKCYYKSWGKYPRTFDAIQQWFEEDLFSLFYSRMHGVDLEDSSVSNGTYCEGIIFIKEGASYQEDVYTEEEHLSGGRYRKIAPKMAKLRRDMFEGWQKGEWPASDYEGH